MARRVLPSRLELKSPEGSSSEAPFANVNFTALLYDSPVQMIPSCDQTGTFHFHSSTTSGSARRMSARTRESISPRQPSSSSILASILLEGESPLVALLFIRFAPCRLGELDQTSHCVGHSVGNDRLNACPRAHRRASHPSSSSHSARR